ncbi:hypothetical protein BDQ12DRAFT_388871 [Crucibulum laeve]|uniref:C3H1-type domain-containing protein n=1 Tax=Crucibulum laeve TaxID=68775 RepID=A0A5C3M831_9AGAR|nr:hypothetical protein BDQ12DRAFT_388871 [Crucibulum laeve]
MTTIRLEDTRPKPHTARAHTRQNSRRMQRPSEGVLAQAPTAPSLAIKAQKEGGLQETRSSSAMLESTRIPSTLESESAGTLSPLFECNQYVDRFGNNHYIPAALPSFPTHIVPSNLISCSPQQNATSEVPSQPSSFEAFGVKAHRTRATSNEICRKFVRNGCCYWDSRCYYIHPLDTALYFNTLFRSSSLRTSEPTTQTECLELPVSTASEPPIASSSQDCSTPRGGPQAKVTPVSPLPVHTTSRHYRAASPSSSSQTTSSTPVTSATHHALPPKLLSTATPDVTPLQRSSRPTG